MARTVRSSNALNVCLVVVYLVAAAGANLAVAAWGTAALPFTAFLLIPLDLVVRMVLFERWPAHQVYPRMVTMVLAGSALSAISSPQSLPVSVASFTAFAAAGIASLAIYGRLRGRCPWWLAAIVADAVGSLVDSTVFPAIAFGVFDPWLTAQQFVIKTLGGAAWVTLFRSLTRSR